MTPTEGPAQPTGDADEPTVEAARTTETSETAETAETAEAPVATSPRRGHRGWVIALIAVATVIAVLASLTAWVNRQALDTDNWVAASDELLDDPDVQSALSQFIVGELYAQVDVQQELADVLPEDLQGLAGPAAAALRQPATEAVSYLLNTNQVQSLWSRVNRTTHETLVGFLEDDLEVISSSGGVVTLELGDLVVQLGQQLGISDDVLDRLPPDAGTITIADSDQLAAAQDAVTLTRVLSVWLFVLVVVLYAVAVYLSPDRRRGLLAVGWSLLGASILLLVVRRLALDYVVSMVENPANEAPARSVFLIGSELLAQLGRAGVVYAVIMVVGAIYAGPSRVARAVRAQVAPLFSPEPWVVWLSAAVVFGLLVLWSPLPAFDAAWSTLVLLVLYGLGVEALRRQSRREFPDAEWGHLGDAVRDRARAGWTSASGWWDRRGQQRGAASTTAAGSSAVEKLERLADLHRTGALDDAEYAAAKQSVLAGG